MVAGIFFSLIPPGEETNKILFEVKVAGGTLGTIAVGLILYYRGARLRAE